MIPGDCQLTPLFSRLAPILRMAEDIFSADTILQVEPKVLHLVEIIFLEETVLQVAAVQVICPPETVLQVKAKIPRMVDAIFLAYIILQIEAMVEIIFPAKTLVQVDIRAQVLRQHNSSCRTIRQ